VERLQRDRSTAIRMLNYLTSRTFARRKLIWSALRVLIRTMCAAPDCLDGERVGTILAWLERDSAGRPLRQSEGTSPHP
jgi:hypothetical protein